VGPHLGGVAPGNGAGGGVEHRLQLDALKLLLVALDRPYQPLVVEAARLEAASEDRILASNRSALHEKLTTAVAGS
jgi:hypothetical protein